MLFNLFQFAILFLVYLNVIQPVQFALLFLVQLNAIVVSTFYLLLSASFVAWSIACLPNSGARAFLAFPNHTCPDFEIVKWIKILLLFCFTGCLHL